MRKIVIGFSKPRGYFKVFSWVIRMFEGWTPYSHVYIKTFSGTTAQWLIYQASGVQVNFMGEKYFLDRAEVYAEFEFEITDFSFKEYMKFAIRHAGAPYGMKAVLGIGLMRIFGLRRNPWADGDKSFYCAELVARALNDFMDADVSNCVFEDAGPKKIFELCQSMRGRYGTGHTG